MNSCKIPTVCKTLILLITIIQFTQFCTAENTTATTPISNISKLSETMAKLSEFEKVLTKKYTVVADLPAAAFANKANIFEEVGVCEIGEEVLKVLNFEVNNIVVAKTRRNVVEPTTTPTPTQPSEGEVNNEAKEEDEEARIAKCNEYVANITDGIRKLKSDYANMQSNNLTDENIELTLTNEIERLQKSIDGLQRQYKQQLKTQENELQQEVQKLIVENGRLQLRNRQLTYGLEQAEAMLRRRKICRYARYDGCCVNAKGAWRFNNWWFRKIRNCNVAQDFQVQLV